VKVECIVPDPAAEIKKKIQKFKYFLHISMKPVFLCDHESVFLGCKTAEKLAFFSKK
jgi:hypothetical protein